MGDDGSLSDLRLFVDQGGEGVATDAEGNVYLAAGDVHVYDPSGALVETIRVPGRPTQLVFGGPDRRTLFMPARDALYAVRTRVPGRRRHLSDTGTAVDVRQESHAGIRCERQCMGHRGFPGRRRARGRREPPPRRSRTPTSRGRASS